MDFARSQKILTGSTCDCVTKSINITAIIQNYKKIQNVVQISLLQ